MLAKFSGVESERTISKFTKIERQFLSCVKASAENEQFSCRSGATMEKKCEKERDASAKLLFC